MVESLFHKVTVIQAATLLKRDSITDVFLRNLQKFLKASILKSTCELLLLKILSNPLAMSKSPKTAILQRMNGLILLYSDLSLTCY